MIRSVFPLLLLITLAFTSCTVDDAPEFQPYNSCMLTKLTYFNPIATHGQEYHYKYNSMGLIDSIERIQWGESIVNGNPDSWVHTSYQVFEYLGSKVNRMISIDGGAEHYFDYSYANGLVSKVTISVYQQDSITQQYQYNVQKYLLYQYDAQGKLIEVKDSSNQINFKYLYSYQGDNLNQIDTEILWSTPQEKIREVFTNFDTHKNFESAVPGLPININVRSHSSVSLNNFQLEEYYERININTPFSLKVDHAYTYQYNTQGFPILMESSYWDATFEYINCN